jgi:hypothetical protein
MNLDFFSQKYKDQIFSRYFVLKEGLFKNTKKIINIYRDSILIENIDESEREIINFEDIQQIQNIAGNKKDFKIVFKTNKGVENTLNFSSNFRTQIICDLLRQIDLYSKINKHPIETFKSFLFFEDYENVMEMFNLDEKNKLSLINKGQEQQEGSIFDITVNLYRSVLEWVNFDSKRELRIRFSDIDAIKVYDDRIIKLETYNKIDLNLIPKNTEDVKFLVEKISENCQNFLGSELRIEYHGLKDFPKSFPLPKTKFFSHQVYRLLYNSYKRSIRLSADFDFLYEIYETAEGVITKINNIPINDIIYLIAYESDMEYFEIVLKSNARYLFQTSNYDRNIIITNLIDLIANKNNNDESNFLLLSSKPKFGMRVIGFINEEVDWEYEKHLFVNLYNCFSEKKIREQLVEDICLNFCFKSEKFSNEPISNKKIFQMIYDLITEEFQVLDNAYQNEDSNLTKNRLYVLNNYLILCKTLITKFHYDKLISDLMNHVDNIQFQTIFYNSISIFKVLIPASGKFLKKDEIAQRKWMISSHFDNAIKIKNLLFSKIFEKKVKISNFEERNILSIYILMELQKNIYEFSKEINLMNEILKEFNQFDFLYILYVLMRCNSNIMKQISIEILLILLKNLTYEQEFYLKNLLLSRTLIFFVMINLFLKSPNEIAQVISLKFLKTFLISHVEATNLMLNLFPSTLFYFVDKKPNPINWLDHEWDNFFKSILRDHNSTQLIWNQICRNEICEFITNLISSYEYFTEDTSLVQALHLDAEDTEKEIRDFDYLIINQKAEEDGLTKYLKMNSRNTPFTNIVSPSKQTIHNLNCSFFCLNFKEIKMEYQTLKKHVFVWQYYLKKIINESGRPNLSQHIEKPKKFWNKLMNEIINTFNDNKIVLIIKTLTLIYKFYFDIIGVFKEYAYFINLFQSTKSEDVRIMIIQMFIVTIEIEEKEIKEPNLKSLIDNKSHEQFVNFISELFPIQKLKSSLKSFSYEDSLKYFKDEMNDNIGNSFLDNKNLILKNLHQDNVNFDKNFSNYTNYANIDESWEKADKQIKACTLIIRLFKMLMKKFNIVSENSQKIYFPVPKIKLVCLDITYFSKILSLLYSENENLVLETIDLVLNFLNDPLTFKLSAHSTNLADIMVFYMIKYKSKSIMKFLDTLYYYNNVFYNFDFYKKNNLLNEDEFEFFNQYPQANKFLVRYFPINLIYFYMTTDFIEFIRILNEDNLSCDLIWNKEMLKNFINCLISSFKIPLHNLPECMEEGNKSQADVNLQINSIFKFNENLKVKYSNLAERYSCFLYYVDIYINKHQPNVSKNIQPSHVVILGKSLVNKLSKKAQGLKNEREFYDKELMINLKTLMKLIGGTCKLNLGVAGMTLLFEINSFILEKDSKESISENEQKILRVILKCVYLSIGNILNSGDEEISKPTSQELRIIETILYQGLIYFFRRYVKNQHDEKARHFIMKSFSSFIEFSTKIPEILDEFIPESAQQVNMFIHKIFHSEIIHPHKSEEGEEEEENKGFNLNSNSAKMLNMFLDLFFEYSKNIKSLIPLIKNGNMLELIFFCLKFKNKKNQDFFSELARKSVFILQKVLQMCLKYKDSDQLISDESKKLCLNFIDAIIAIFDKQLTKDLSKPTEDNDYFLLKIKSSIENPEFIWNKKFRHELKHKLLKMLKKIDHNEDFDYLSDLKSFTYKAYEEELKIHGIYIRIYNKDPKWYISEPDSFLEKLKIHLCNSNDNLIQNELLIAISNLITNAKVDESIILENDIFLSKFFELLESKNNPAKDLVVPSCLRLLVTLSNKEHSLKSFVLQNRTMFVLVQILEYNNSKDFIDPIAKILRSVIKQNQAEIVNLAIFLFLLKKVMFLKTTITKINKETVFALRVEIIKVIKKYVLNEKVGDAIKSLFEFYLPRKIIDNLFASKDVGEISLNWIDNELELPDLIWNNDAMNQSKKLLEEDCTFILTQINNNNENFPQNLLSHKLDPHKYFFFEIFDEYRIEGIYLRIFNKDPSYNIGRSLLIFMKKVFKSACDGLTKYTLTNCGADLKIQNQSISKLKELLYQKSITSLTAICLILEQVNFNDFNECLGISSNEEMKNTAKDENEKNLISLVQRSFDYQKLIQTSFINKLLSFSRFIFGISENLFSNFNHFDSNLRLVYLEIIYMLTLNKVGLPIICENLPIIEIMEVMYANQDNIGDCKYLSLKFS